MDDASFIRYLAAKKSVDDRALNRRVWDAMIGAARTPFVSGKGPRVLELGGGIGTMIDRVAEEGRLQPASWTMIDEQAVLIAKAREKFAQTAPFPLELLATGLDAYLASPFQPFDLVIASAFLDLLDPSLALPRMRGLCRPGGLFLFSITFDGLTVLEPEIDRDLDTRIMELYHRTMDERIAGGKRSGDSRCGRHLLTLLPRCGCRILAAGSSDWIVHPSSGEYPADERFFLSCILDFFEESLSARPEVDRTTLHRWLRARREQLARTELVFMAHQLDVLASVEVRS
jgi:ubiquinone/menaquinone biosynthesis C-methylase UbiE